MKNNLLYYLTIFLPLAGIIYMMDMENSQFFVLLLFTYGFIYRPIVDYYRLKSRNRLGDMKLINLFISPFYTLRKFNDLYWFH